VVFRSPVLRLALLTASAVLTFAGCNCGRECTVSTDCPNSGQVCDQGVCKEGPDGGQTCDPACPTNQFCDTPTLTCKNCDGTTPGGTGVNRGCLSGLPICDTAANGGAGQCRSCAPSSTDGGTDQGCAGTTPSCDPTANGGNGACLVCTPRNGCGNGRVCDTSVAGGLCRTCLASTDGGVAPGCTAAEPICNQSVGRCLVCTSTTGCTGSTICDPNANSGKGQCDYCRPSTDGGVAPGCSAGSPVCDSARDGGFGACIVCNASAGCPSSQVCQTSANSGSGQCFNCYDSDAGAAVDPGCTSGTPVCNTAGSGGLGTCLGCLSDVDCPTDPNRVCDDTTNTCKICSLTPVEGCGPSQVCDPAGAGGQGSCLGCTGDPDCALSDGGTSATPFCKTSPPPGVCVACVSSTSCTDPTKPACTSNNVCGCSASADCSGTPATPVCDTAASSGNGTCVFCTATAGCSADPTTPVCLGGTQCVCSSTSCPPGYACTGSPLACTISTTATAMVVRVGNGSSALASGVAAPVFIEEYRVSDGTLLRTIPMPVAADTDGGTNLPFTLQGTSTTEGGLSRSADGKYVTMGGYDTAPGTTGVGNASATTIPRMVGRVDAAGVVNTSTQITTAFSGGATSSVSIRAATSLDGTAFWTTGSNSGVVYVNLGSTGATTAVSTGTPTNIRHVNIFGGQLYITSASGAFQGVSKVGAGTPTNSGNVIMLLPGFPAAGGGNISPLAFAALDTDATAGIDTIYESHLGGAGSTWPAGTVAIEKWTLVGAAWSKVGTFAVQLANAPASTGVFGLSAVVEGSAVRVIATTGESPARLITFVDDGSNPTPSATVLATAATNTAYRGVALSPTP